MRSTRENIMRDCLREETNDMDIEFGDIKDFQRADEPTDREELRPLTTEPFMRSRPQTAVQMKTMFPQRSEKDLERLNKMYDR